MHRQPADRRLIFAVVMPHPSLFRRFVSLLLAVLVLTASVGLTVQRYTCRMSGRSTVAVSVAGDRAAEDGCGKDATATSVVKDSCCDFSSHLHKVSTPAPELAAKVLVPTPQLLAWLAPPAWAGAASRPAAAATAGPRWFAADASPPPRSGRALLAFVCTLEV